MKIKPPRHRKQCNMFCDEGYHQRPSDGATFACLACNANGKKRPRPQAYSISANEIAREVDRRLLVCERLKLGVNYRAALIDLAGWLQQEEIPF